MTSGGWVRIDLASSVLIEVIATLSHRPPATVHLALDCLCDDPSVSIGPKRERLTRHLFGREPDPVHAVDLR